jgi:hypothetical protein
MVGTTPESHRTTRFLQAINDEDYHHPKEKIEQLLKHKQYLKGDILEVFAGQGNLTSFYKPFGTVTAMTKEEFGDSFDAIYKLRGEKRKFDVIDIDSYGYPDRFFPVVFEIMKKECLLVFTFPIIGCNCLNGISEQHFYTFYRSIPTVGDVVGCITDWGLREWKICSLLDVTKIKRIYRFVFLCKQGKATEICNVRNR